MYTYSLRGRGPWLALLAVGLALSACGEGPPCRGTTRRTLDWINGLGRTWIDRGGAGGGVDEDVLRGIQERDVIDSVRCASKEVSGSREFAHGVVAALSRVGAHGGLSEAGLDLLASYCTSRDSSVAQHVWSELRRVEAVRVSVLRRVLRGHAVEELVMGVQAIKYLGESGAGVAGDVLSLLDTVLFEQHSYEIIGLATELIERAEGVSSVCECLPRLGERALPMALRLLRWTWKAHGRGQALECVRGYLLSAPAAQQERILRGLDHYGPWDDAWLALARLVETTSADPAVAAIAAGIVKRPR